MYLFGNSLKLFGPENRVRRLCHQMLSQKITNTFFLVLLLLQTHLLGYRQWNPAVHGYVAAGNNWADYVLIVINVIYTLEMAAKVIAYGFFDDKVMFKELNLPYPRNEIRAMLFQGKWAKVITGYLSLVLQKAHPRKTRSFYDRPKPTYESYSDSANEIELEDQSPNYLHNKYVMPSHHDETTFADQTDMSSRPILGDQRPESEEILLKPLSKNDIDILQIRRAYIRNSWHRVDFISILTFWISLFLSIDKYDVKNHIMIFRALSCLRILRLCNLTTGTSMILRSLKLAVPQLIDVSILITCFGIFFGIIGVQSFKSSLRRYCVWYNPDDLNDTWVNTSQHCGCYQSASGTALPYIMADGKSSSTIKGFMCPVNSRCETLENPNENTVSFDNIFNSLELVFVVMSANTFTDLMYQAMDSEGLVACLFFVFCLFIMTVWLLNVFIAIIVSSFNLARVGNTDNEKEWVISHQEIIEDLKKRNIWLATYYQFQFMFSICVAIDIITQCLRAYNETRWTDHLLYRMEASMTALFGVEILVRFFLYLPQWRLFFKLKRNCIDLILAVITCIIILPPVKDGLGHSYYWLTVFQIMRFYRIVLLTRFTRDLWLKILGSWKQLMDLTVFLFLITFLTGIIYSRFFEGSLTEEQIAEGSVHFNLQTLPNAFVSLYVITSTENWTSILYPVQGYQSSLSAKIFAAIFLIGWFFISNFVILNIFISVIANTLVVPEDEKKRKQLSQFIENITASIQNVDNESSSLARFKNKFFKRKDTQEQLHMAVVKLLLSGTVVHEFLDAQKLDEPQDDPVRELPSNRLKRFIKVHLNIKKYFSDDPFKIKKPKKGKTTGLAGFDPTNYAKTILNDRNKLIDRQNQFLRENPSYNKVFYVMGPRHKIRKFCQRIVTSSHGERIDGVEPNKRVSDIFAIFMLLSTLALLITACYLTPLIRAQVNAENGVYSWTYWLDISFIAIFTIEFIIRVLADGFSNTPNAYIRSPWNRIDGTVLMALWVEMIAYMKSKGDLSRFIRGLKALRALRLLTISETAKNNFHNTMFSGFSKIVNAALISVTLLYPFSIWALNIFNGRLGYCVDGVSTLEDCYNEYTNSVFNWEILSPNVYAQPLLQFDDFSHSFSALFEITSLEGWVDLLYNVMASTGVGTVPSPFATPFNGFFVILFNFIGIVFVLTLFISVIIHNYSLTTGRAYMTVDQRSWYQVKQFLLQIRPSKRIPHERLGWFRKFCYTMTVEKNKSWNSVLNVALFFHIVALLVEMYPLHSGLSIFRLIVFLIVSGLFTCHAFMLLFARGLKYFITNKWLVFNFLISFGAFTTTIVGTQISAQSAFMNINKLFLVGTMFFMIPRSDRLSQFLKFASAGLPDMFSLMFTWLVLFLLFSIALNQVFGTTKIGPNGSDNINVRTVPKALILLFKCSFGEGWNYIMDDFKVEPPFCYSDSTSTNTDCGNVQYAYFLFICWNLISMYIFLNMFVSLILDSFSYIMNKGDYGKLIERNEIRKFKLAWQKFDPEGTGFIPPRDLHKFLKTLDGAFSFQFYAGTLDIPVLCHRWFKRNNLNDPYDITVNYPAISDTFASWDTDKIRERRKSYETFIEEAIVNMELNHEPGISFKRVILQLPLYKVFDIGTCLNLIDFLDRRLLLQKVQKRQNQNKVYETITAFILRWKYVNLKKHGISTSLSTSHVEDVVRRRSYLSEDWSPIPSQYADDKFEKDFGALEDKSKYDRLPMSDSGEENDDNDEYHRSGVYIPKSPLNTNKQFKSPKPQPPKLKISVMDSDKLKPVVPTFNFKLVEPDSAESINANDLSGESSHSHEVIDLADVGENLRDSGWMDMLKDLHDPKT
ncbi:hypothetical protein CANTEDRAFT_104682 [Yamadazyma tenuis ATCC 10573]|uniref:Calcium-channel protein CCH1 n=2 Tax=Candida tenuis TaxID=2315449 RepID=G3B3G8_CANTC|nr:uncharacterized protein CANTEDRAFT_104682 [Yamadazyma tenuis ATCC 10573]EGV64159.1 hypothetical protein CANTEDRAFT_104682 [Yamadazyma tenuis ATCC 10573]